MSDFRDHLTEHLEDPEFKAAWESEADLREKMGREVEARLCRQFGTTLVEVEADVERRERGDFSDLAFADPVDGKPEGPADGSKEAYVPIRISPDDPRVKHPARDSEGIMIWDDEDPDEGGAIYERYATR